MPEKFSGGSPPGKIQALDEIRILVCYSPSGQYIDMTEEKSKSVDPLQAANVFLVLAMRFLNAAMKERSMVIGNGGESGSTEKSSENGD